MGDGFPGPGPRGEFSPLSHPQNFPDNRNDLARQTMRDFIHVFGAGASNGNSAVFSMQKCFGFTVFSTGTMACEIDASPEPTTNIWVTIDTLANEDHFATTNHYPFIRINKTGGDGNVYIVRRVVPGMN